MIVGEHLLSRTVIAHRTLRAYYRIRQDRAGVICVRERYHAKHAMDGLSGVLIAYWLISLGSSIVSVAMGIRATLTVRDPLHSRILQFSIAMLFVTLFSFIAELNWHRPPPYNDAARILSMMFGCFLIIVIPRALPTEIRAPLWARWFFPSMGFIMFLHYLGTSVVFYTTKYDGTNHYFAGYRLIPAFTVFVLQIVAEVYTAVQLLAFRFPEDWDIEIRRTIRSLALSTLMSIPFFFVIDLVRYYFPVLWALLPEERLIIHPGYNVILNVHLFLIHRNAIKRHDATVPLDRNLLLSPREVEVAELLSRGATYNQIAHALHISLSTVQSHVKNIYRKTGVSNKTELARFLHD